MRAKALAVLVLVLLAGCGPALVSFHVDVKNRANEERMIWLTTEWRGEGESVEIVAAARALGIVEPLRLRTFDLELREDFTYEIVGTDRTGEPSKPLHATGRRRPRDGERLEVVIER